MMKESIFIIAVCIAASSSFRLTLSKDEHLDGPHVMWQGCGQFDVYRDRSRDIKFYVFSFNGGSDNKCKIHHDYYLKTCPFWVKANDGEGNEIYAKFYDDSKKSEQSFLKELVNCTPKFPFITTWNFGSNFGPYGPYRK